MSSCDSCPSKSSCTSQSTCPTANAENNQQDKQNEENSFLINLSEASSVKKIIGICSGKGGVGKSLVTSMLATSLMKKGYKVGILDADITGPSIPQAFGLKDTLTVEDELIVPCKTSSGIQVVSINLLLENPEAPVLWRGPVISGTVKQFYSQTKWEGLDVLLIDMPPGTGDVSLTVFQSIPLDGIVLVSTPQDLVSMIVNKARNMALMMQVKVLGFVENMSYVKCGKCGEIINIFGDSNNVTKAASEMGVGVLDRLPLDPSITDLVDKGTIEEMDETLLEGTANKIIDMLK